MLDERFPCTPCSEKSEASANRCLKMSFRWLPNMWIALVIAKYIMTLLEDSVGNELCGRCTFDLWSWSYYSALQHLSTRSHWYDPKDRCVSPFSSLLFIETPKWISKRESSDSLFTSSTLFKWRAYGPRAFLDWSYTLIFFNIMPSTLCSFLMIFIESMFPSCASTLMKSDLICPFSLPNGSWPCLLMYWLCSRFLFLLESSLFCSLPSLVLHLFGCIPSHCSCYAYRDGLASFACLSLSWCLFKRILNITSLLRRANIFSTSKRTSMATPKLYLLCILICSLLQKYCFYSSIPHNRSPKRELRS